MAEPERIVDLSHALSRLADQKISSINAINREAKYLALNALVESSRAGAAGKGFAIVAQEVKAISDRIAAISGELTSELAASIHELSQLGDAMIRQMQAHRGQRLTDLALNMVEIMDRNLYERSCDVRWWATDSAVVDALSGPSDATAAHASQRLGVILDSYTVYVDLWIADRNGRVIANGRPQQFARAVGTSVAHERWFKDAMKTSSGSEFAVVDVCQSPTLGRQVATYSAAVRSGGRNTGQPIGALGIFFDWQPQAAAVIKSVSLTADEWTRTRCLLVDGNHRVLAASDNNGILQEHVTLQLKDAKRGHYSHSDGRMIGYALTPGYETYRGLGWYGVVVQSPHSMPVTATAARRSAA
jgi:Methyl-accepting chemotaxis protein (MCP) signalling domain